MNILIPNSWLREFLETNATPKQFAEAMSLTSVSIERMDKVHDDIVFDIEVTTNRPDLMSVEGIAREASAVLLQAGYKAKFIPLSATDYQNSPAGKNLLEIESDPSLVNRILAVVMEINLDSSPKIVSSRLEKTGIRSKNNVIDVTNYIMREVGHPAHVFDYDRLKEGYLKIRKSKKGEKIVTLDNKEFVLKGDDIIAVNKANEIVDLLGIMGCANSVVIDSTKRVVLFLDNNNPSLLRKTSMSLGIRSEAVILNEKGVDPEIMIQTFNRGIELLIKYANGKVISKIIDIYPNKPKSVIIKVNQGLIKKIIGIEIDNKVIFEILRNLDFKVIIKGDEFIIDVPTRRIDDILIPEDIIEEIARVYGYHKIPNVLPNTVAKSYFHLGQSEFYWVKKIKNALLFWGFNEVYCYSMVSEELFEGPIENALKIRNPLTDDRVYLRNSIIPSLLEVAKQNKNRDVQKLFEISNVYIKNKSGLPDEIQHLGILLKDSITTFFDAKGITEQLFALLGITSYEFKKNQQTVDGVSIIVEKKVVGFIQIDEIITIDLDLSFVLNYANLEKVYNPASKFPPIIEDVRVEMNTHYTFSEIENEIKNIDPLVNSVELLDVYEKKKTFRITYLDHSSNLTNSQIIPIRLEINKMLETSFNAKIG